jgi:chemotaxis protein methyltransferase CheR
MPPLEPFPTHWEQLSDLIAGRMGLYFPRERWPQLRQGLAGAGKELGFPGIERFVAALLATPPTPVEIQVLASHLTIGETYFFREKPTFEALEQVVLPELIRSRRERGRELRVWSAACCTGEETYSLAILLRRLLPDLPEWHISILGTDINPRYLRKAAAARYSEWSFRSTPDGFRERYFHEAVDGLRTVVPEIRAMVKFSPLNLVEDIFPAGPSGTGEIDLLLCRNALMYFRPDQIRKVVDKFHRVLGVGGHLVVSPSESSKAYFPQFTARNHPGAIFYEKTAPGAAPAADSTMEYLFEVAPERVFVARVDPTPATPPPVERDREPKAPEALSDSVLSLRARSLADEGKLPQALIACDLWLGVDPLNAAGHFLRAVVLLELGDGPRARTDLQQAVYLDGDFVAAHLALAHLARREGRRADADRHFANAQLALAAIPPDALLPETEGITARQFAQTIALARPWGISA